MPWPTGVSVLALGLASLGFRVGKYLIKAKKVKACTELGIAQPRLVQLYFVTLSYVSFNLDKFNQMQWKL